MELDPSALDKVNGTIVRGEAHDVSGSLSPCLAETHLDPCCIVVLGATGDLSMRKLLPAIYNLFLSKELPNQFTIIGAARTRYDHEGFRDKVRLALDKKDLQNWGDFSRHLYYQSLDFDSPDSFRDLAKLMEVLQEQHKTFGNRLFYLALPPSLYASVAAMLGSVGLASNNSESWTRLVVEKPFGRDLQSARELNHSLQKHFHEDQIFRIDHYLAKETVQNIMALRFANAIFEPIWNRMYIDRVNITAAESLGIEKRAEYYEESGVLRDMFQNHMLQLLALTAMEPPARFEAELVRDEKGKVFRSLRPFDVNNIERQLILGQYDSGVISDRNVNGYREESGVDRKSRTPTFAMMTVYVENWRWQGVPFYITSGKRLAEKRTEIVIHFKKAPHSIFQDTLSGTISPNLLTLGIYPEETINMKFETKNPGSDFCLRSVTMDFHYRENHRGPNLDAYEMALIEAMQGDHMLFWRQDAVELCWEFLDPVLEACEACSDKELRLHYYKAGSWGPKAASHWRV